MLQSLIQDLGGPARLLFGFPADTAARSMWADDGDDLGCAEFGQLMAHTRRLMDRGLPVGMAVIMGEADTELSRELKDQICRSGECISWASWGPLVAVVFRPNLVREMAPLLREVFYRYPDIRVGVALSDLLTSHADLWLAARLALETAMGRRDNLVMLDGDEASRSVFEYRMAAAMRRELHEGGGAFEAYYQPQVKLDSLLPVGAEALARWTWNGQAIPPAAFVPVAERFGLVGAMGETMLRQTAVAIGRLRCDGIDVPKIAVNVSPAQMGHGDFLRAALQLLWDEGLSPTDVELEITESLAGEGGVEFRAWVAELVAAGFHIAIDDFGTGSSTLARIREIPATKLKLDRAFVSPLPDDMSGRRICRMAVTLARSLGMLSLAEGVETHEQAIYLKNAGCQMGQGYLWGRPMPAADLAHWWRRQEEAR